MSDKFDTHSPSLVSPAGGGQAVVPNDSTELSTYSRAVYIGSAGSLAVELVHNAPGVTTVFQNLQTGVIYPLRVRKILATGTTAAAIVSLW